MKKIIVICLLLVGLVLYNHLLVSATTPSSVTISNGLKEVPKDADYICYINFSQPSAEERFYIYDMSIHKFIYSGLTQHGSGKGNTARRAKFSNEIGSGCSSLGVYEVTSYENMHTIPIKCFRLKGLSLTNSNAETRGIVIHPSLTASLVPFELKGASLPLTIESKGCFAVDLQTMQAMKQCFNKGKVYLYAYQ